MSGAVAASRLSHLECSACSSTLEPTRLWNLCECGAPLLARYAHATPFRVADLAARGDMWRYAPLLPHRGDIVTLGEGATPTLPLDTLAKELGLRGLYAKDESQNPTGSFKARGLSAAVTMAHSLGAQALAIPTAGNAGGALAAYGARVGLAVQVFMPADTPRSYELEARLHGAEVTRVDGLIDDCGKLVRERALEGRWYDVSTLKEPYRLEGKKTLGFEIFEQLQPLPDAILYPTGGGTGLIGIWKAFEELRALGWTDAPTPRLVAVQSAGCAPMVRAFDEGADHAERWKGAATAAVGLRVPQAVGDRLILRAVRESGGMAIAVEESDMLSGMHELAAKEGFPAGPETGALVAAAHKLLQTGWLGPDQCVLLLSTASWHKLPDTIR